MSRTYEEGTSRGGCRIEREQFDEQCEASVAAGIMALQEMAEISREDVVNNRSPSMEAFRALLKTVEFDEPSKFNLYGLLPKFKHTTHLENSDAMNAFRQFMDEQEKEGRQ